MSDAEDQDEWSRLWAARKTVLELALGPATDKVFHALVPLQLGGSADVLEFPQHTSGSTYVTADLVGDSGQPENSLGQYELMICTRQRDDWAPNLISRLATYTLESVLEPFETMDIGSAVPPGSTVTALLFIEPDLPSNEYLVAGQRCGLLLCLGITPSELQACFEGRVGEVLAALKAKGIFPHTDLHRESVVGAGAT